MRHVIVGAGPAGVTAADTIRSRDPSAEIVLVGDEPGLPYARMTLPYLVSRTIGEPGTLLRRDPEHYERTRVRRVEGAAARVDTARREVMLSGGTTLAYDRLLIASGSRMRVPPIEGVGLDGVHRCWTLAQARRLRTRVGPGSRVVMLGAGFIGAVLMDALVSRGARVTLVEMADQVLPRMLDRIAANLVRRWCEARGVRVLTSTVVDRVRAGSNGTPLWVGVRGGDELPADVAVLATGVRPATSFLEGSGVAVESGVLVDSSLRASAPDVFAAGDVAEGPVLGGRSRDVHAVQPTAAEHGRVAGLNMLGEAVPYRGSLVMNVLETVGLVSCAIGRCPEGGDVAEATDESRCRYLRLQFEGQRIVGAVSVGARCQVGALRGLIQSGAELGPWKERLRRGPHRVSEAFLARVVGP